MGYEGLVFDLDGSVFGGGFFFGFGVGFDVVEEVFLWVGGGDVFDVDVDVFFDVGVLDFFVDDYVESGFGDVVDDISFVVVDFVGYIVWVLVCFCLKFRNVVYCDVWWFILFIFFEWYCWFWYWWCY